EEKRVRRVALGEHLTAVFENRDTVLLQIQEMLRTERITTESAILHEIETYNDLIPARGQLSVTLFVEIAERELRERMLLELAGLEDALALEIDGVPSPLRGKREGALPDRTTAVHYLKVELSAEAQAGIRSGQAAVALVAAHPRYAARAELPPGTVTKL